MFDHTISIETIIKTRADEIDERKFNTKIFLAFSSVLLYFSKHFIYCKVQDG